MVRHRILVPAFQGSNPCASELLKNVMVSSNQSVKALVLAAGKGVRMKSDLPKVLHQLAGKPLVMHVLENLKAAGIADIIAVVGYRGEMVQETVDTFATIVWQKEQLGTGHAVMQAENALKGFDGGVVVACGDVPLMKPETFRAAIDEGRREHVRAVVVTMQLDNPFGYGRIIRDENGNIARIVEEKDANEEDKRIKEVNTGTYYFDAKLLFEGLSTVGTDNAQKEYYLPDVIQYIRQEGYLVKPLLLKDPLEGAGINSKEELQRIEEMIQGKRIHS